MEKGGEGRMADTFTAAAAWPGGLRSVERFAAAEGAERGESVSLRLC